MDLLSLAHFFFMFCLIFLEITISSIRVSKLDTVSIAPENLNLALETFRFGLMVESHGFPAEAMVKTKSWGQLQSTVSGYAQRLELIENQNRRRSITVSCLYLFSAIGMVTFGRIELKNRIRQQKFKDVQPSTEI
ncbi:MAG: hypothetical protein B6I25_00900 [Planctomycetales bacterium 4572_13]|nr:MAG: hypothetical protein B6I25_00900 [Planctomycetales bacterium 4572_13]